jgi:hypothetical protein
MDRMITGTDRKTAQRQAMETFKVDSAMITQENQISNILCMREGQGRCLLRGLSQCGFFILSLLEMRRFQMGRTRGTFARMEVVCRLWREGGFCSVDAREENGIHTTEWRRVRAISDVFFCFFSFFSGVFQVRSFSSSWTLILFSSLYFFSYSPPCLC